MSGVTNQEEDKKPIVPSAHITLRVKEYLDGNEVFFRIRRSTELQKLMNAYCDRKSMEHDKFGFVFNGRRILSGKNTPDELEMEDGDEIFAIKCLCGC